MSYFDRQLAKVIANRRIDDGDNTLTYKKKWGLPEGYVRQCLTRPDMDDNLMEAALMLEVDEDDIMNHFANETALCFTSTNEFGSLSMGVDFTDGRNKTAFVYGLTPTILMFIATHLSREEQTREVYNPGGFRRFCELYYENEPSQEYKQIVTPEMWNKAIDDAVEHIVSNYQVRTME